MSRSNLRSSLVQRTRSTLPCSGSGANKDYSDSIIHNSCRMPSHPNSLSHYWWCSFSLFFFACYLQLSCDIKRLLGEAGRLTGGMFRSFVRVKWATLREATVFVSGVSSLSVTSTGVVINSRFWTLSERKNAHIILLSRMPPPTLPLLLLFRDWGFQM